jgi:hypothetical protein
VRSKCSLPTIPHIKFFSGISQDVSVDVYSDSSATHRASFFFGEATDSVTMKETAKTRPWNSESLSWRQTRERSQDSHLLASNNLFSRDRP